MPYSGETIAFATIPAADQVRFEDRISFAYLEHAEVVQDRTGVIALGRNGSEYLNLSIQVPVASLAVLVLGPGTSITQAAMTSCARAGATVLFSGSEGISAYAVATPLTSSARWAIAQANLVSSETAQREAAMVLYKKQFGLEAMPGGSIRTMRGFEGRLMRNLYGDLAKKHKVGHFKRDIGATDDVNIGLNISNSILYGCASSACAAIGVNPALGVIHRGNSRSLLFDLGDVFKPTLIIPAVFECVGAEDLPKAVRTRTRKELHEHRVLKQMIETLMEILGPHLPGLDRDTLIAEAGETLIDGHVQYGKDQEG